MLVAALGTRAAYAERVFEQIESSYELRLVRVQLPRSSTGSLSFRTCGDCALQTLPVTTGTRYFIGDQEVILSELTQHVQALQLRPDLADQTQVMAHYALSTERVTRLVIRTFSR